MTKLVQKSLFHGTQEFEIDGEQLHVRIKTPFKQESLTVLLSVLNPEPVIDKATLDFVSRVNGEPLVSLRLAKPDPQRFNDFVSTLKQLAAAEYNAFSGIRSGEAETAPELGGNSYDEPPEFDDDQIRPAHRQVNTEEVDTAIRMLETHLESGEVATLLAALQALRDAPEDYARLTDLARVFGELGASQGAVLTYAPYVGLLLSDDPFDRS
jgi:hypothetical protein